LGPRRKGREAALQLLYQLELSGDRADEAHQRFWLTQPDATPAIREFAEALVERTLERSSEIDAVIDEAAVNWQLERIARVDLYILRLAVSELLGSPDIPAAVIVNEAIEIARRYSDAEAPAFVNGILDRIARRQGRFQEA
jgi:N utilization substance protein B